MSEAQQPETTLAFPFMIISSGAAVPSTNAAIAEGRANALAEQAAAIRAISTEADAAEARGVLGRCKEVAKIIDDGADPIIKNAYDLHRRLTKAKRDLLGQMPEAANALRARLNEYETEKERQRLAAEAEVNAAIAKTAEERRLKEALRVEAEHGTVAADAALAVVEPKVEIEIPRERTKGSSVRVRWKFEIENPTLVPREYCSPDRSLIDATVQMAKGETTIPGVRVYFEAETAIRANRP